MVSMEKHSVDPKEKENIMKNKGVFKLVLFISILALAGISCGVSNIGNLFATATPTPTSTFTPTPTSTPSPTPTLTPTNTPTATPMPDATIENLADGSTRFTDFVGGYSFILPEGWLVINFVVDDPQQALEDAIKANPDKSSILNGFQSAIGKNERMGAADFIPGQFNDLSAPIIFNALDNSTQFMALSDIVAANGQMIPQLLNAEVTTSEIMENPFGVPYGVLDIIIKLSADNQTASIVEKLVIFKTDDYTVYVTLAVLDGLKEGGFQGVDKLIDSLELLP